MKYKLEKLYPGSPSLNSIIESENYQDKAGNIINVLDFPEFWKEVKERNYEILSIKRVVDNTIFNKNINNSFHYDNQRFFTEEELLSKKNDYFVIYSVKRISDGEIFTIGDKVKDSLTNELTNNKIQTIRYFSYNSLKMICILESTATAPLATISKVKNPLFITHDLVEIFEGDNYWAIDSKKLNFIVRNGQFGYISARELVNNIFFSTEKKAEEYIFNNKPCLSLNDVSSIYISANSPIKFDTKKTAQNYRIQELVKEKLKNF